MHNCSEKDIIQSFIENQQERKTKNNNITDKMTVNVEELQTVDLSRTV